MRIGIAQVWQETNTLNPVPTTRADFEAFGVLRGAAIVEQLADTNEPGGFIQSLRSWPERPEIVPLVRLPAWPGGTATAETFAWMQSQLIAALRSAGPLDGLLLALHGAMAADGRPDVEGEMLAAVRDVIGRDVPLVATLDLHANVTAQMVRHADALVLFHTAPHIDVFETGVRGARVLRRLLVDGVRPSTAFVKLPLVLPAERADTQNPASVSFGFRERLQALERRGDVLTAGLATVQPWLDVPELGTAVLVTTTGDADLARAEAERLAQDVWDRRREYLPTLTPIDEAVRAAHENPAGLTVLSDAADATTSGAPGDATALLAELVKFDWPRGAVATLVAPEAVDAAVVVGSGGVVEQPFGGRRDARFNRPLPLRTVVERVFEARFTINGHLGKNLAIDMGTAVVLRTGDVRLVVTARSGPHFAPELFQAAGIDPFAQQVLVAKSPCGFRAVYSARAAQIFSVRTPGCAPADFQNYAYRNIPRPLWPWDEFGHRAWAEMRDEA